MVGLARSGVGAANLLVKEGREVVATDTRTAADLGDTLKGLDPAVRLALGGHPDGLMEGAGLVVISPGVPWDIGPLENARKAGVEVIGELELGYRAYEGVPFLAVTGTNGKSTTVSLLKKMMDKCGRQCLLGGNIGRPLTAEAAAGVSADCVVAEVSSFQLETVSRFHAQGAAILNVTPDHLDRYPSIVEYAQTKARIAEHQRESDVLVLNADDPGCMEMYERYFTDESQRRVMFFSRERKVWGIYLSGDTIVVNAGLDADGDLVRTTDIGIRGVHNVENAMAASLLALVFGCPADPVRAALSEFSGLAHRLEFVRELDGVKFVNDSKGTNVAAVLKSLEGFTEPVVLIAGGRDKAGDFAPLAELLGDKARAVVLIGEASQKIGSAIAGAVKCVRAQSMDEAVRLSSGLARPGDTVLLSPACASFDMFTSFEDRGDKFKEAVERL